MTSTNALTGRYCRLKGWPSQTVQAFYGRKRHDLFGLWDTIILHPHGLIFVQNCCYGSLKAHRDSMEKIPELAFFDRQAARLELWEWRRKKVSRKKLWFLRVQARTGSGWGDAQDWIGPLAL